MIEWIANPKHMLVYLGSPGVGKTYFCAALIPFVVEKFPSYRAYHERELLRRLRSSIESSSGDYLEHLKGLIDDAFIMIDDLGSSGVTEWRKEVLFDAVDYRYSTQLPTVITSNLSGREIAQEYGQRLASRLLSKENTIIEAMNGFDFRQMDPENAI